MVGKYDSEPSPGQWTTGLCACYEDFSSCFTTFCCPVITFGRNVEMIEKGKISCETAARAYLFWLVCMHCCPYVYSCTYRNKLRGLFSLPEQPCKDCFVHFCCICCALCQEYRELKNRGLDPAKGWSAYEEKMKVKASTTPPNAPRMVRY